MSRLLHVCNTDMQYLYSRVFAENEKPGGAVEYAPTAPPSHLIRNGELAFFRNGQWEYEPDPNREAEESEEEIADDQ